MPIELISTTAVAMAGLSLGLTIGSAVASRRGACPSPAIAPPSIKPISLRPALQEHAREIGIDRSKSWIHRATRQELQQAIRAHNEQRRVA